MVPKSVVTQIKSCYADLQRKRDAARARGETASVVDYQDTLNQIYKACSANNWSVIMNILLKNGHTAKKRR